MPIGELILSSIGMAERLKCGVLGDNVNLAARIDALTIEPITKGLAAYQDGDLNLAHSLFSRAQADAPRDPLAAHLLARCAGGAP